MTLNLGSSIVFLYNLERPYLFTLYKFRKICFYRLDFSQKCVIIVYVKRYSFGILLLGVEATYLYKLQIPGGLVMSFDRIIAITRQYGSGGHDIGKALAERLGISFYDKELISIAAKESGVSPEVFKHADERATNSLLYSLSVGLYNYGNNFSSVGDLPVNDRLYILQHKIIKQLAEKENFVVVGRCADYVLKDNPKLVKVYIYADLDKRIKRAVDRQDIDPARAKQAVLKADKNRANYYSFYSGKKWGLPDNYDLCLNSTNITVDQAVDIIISYINICDSNKK